MPQTVKEILSLPIINFIYVIEWLTYDEKVINEVTLDVIGGNINFDGTTSSRRSMSITLKNLDGKYLPKPSNSLWVNNKFRLKAGYEYNNKERLLFNQGIYCITNPSILSSPSRKEVKINGLCKWSLLDGTLAGKLKNKLILPVGTKIDVAMRSIMSEIGETKYKLDNCNTELPYTVEAEPGTPIAKVIEEIAYIVSYETFYDNEGFFIFRRFIEPEEYEITPSTWEYTTSGIYLESERELVWDEVKNSILIVGDTLPNGITISAIAQDNSNSDMSISAIGEKFEKIEDYNITEIPLAEVRANWELKKRIMLAEKVRAQIIPNFSHTVGDIITINDIYNGCQGNYIIQSIDYDTSYSPVMSMRLWKIRNWR